MGVWVDTTRNNQFSRSIHDNVRINFKIGTNQVDLIVLHINIGMIVVGSRYNPSILD
jgi:hypothetical protein